MAISIIANDFAIKSLQYIKTVPMHYISTYNGAEGSLEVLYQYLVAASI